MCLTITVRSNELSGDDQRRLVKEFPLLHRGRDNVLSVHGCDFLSASADWNAPTWEMTVDGRKALEDLLRNVMNRLTGRVEFTALWDGDRPEVEHAVTALQLLSLVDRNRLETHAKYNVAPRGYS
jgi:hypothetical protein